MTHIVTYCINSFDIESVSCCCKGVHTHVIHFHADVDSCWCIGANDMMIWQCDTTRPASHHVRIFIGRLLDGDYHSLIISSRILLTVVIVARYAAGLNVSQKELHTREGIFLNVFFLNLCYLVVFAINYMSLQQTASNSNANYSYLGAHVTAIFRGVISFRIFNFN